MTTRKSCFRYGSEDADDTSGRYPVCLTSRAQLLPNQTLGPGIVNPESCFPSDAKSVTGRDSAMIAKNTFRIVWHVHHWLLFIESVRGTIHE